MHTSERTFPALDGRAPVRVALLTVAIIITFCAYASRTINLFYFHGAYYFDAGWHSYLLSRFEFPPTNPLLIQQTDGPPFFAIHVSPILPLWGLLAQSLGMSPPTAFAVYQGTLHAVLVLAGV